jgi:hypothetical protein
VLSLTTDSWISCLATDVPTGIVCLLAAAQLCALLTAGAAEPRVRAYQVLCVTLPLTLAACLKLHMLVFAGLASFTAVGYWLVQRRPLWPGLGRDLAWIAGASCLLLGAWMGRGIVLSGYPLFPSTLCAMPVDWRVPERIAERQVACIRCWERLPLEPFERRLDNPLLQDFAWVGQWWKMHRLRQYGTFEATWWGMWLPLLLGGALAAALAGCAWRMGRYRPSALTCVLPPLVVALVVWFVNAPAPRFVWQLFWMLPATLAAGLFARAGAFSRSLLTATLLGCLALGVSQVQMEHLWVDQGDDRGMHRHPEATLRPQQVRSGLVYYTPLVGDQTWEGPLVSSAHLDEGLRYRCPGDLQSGFAIDP